MSNEKSSGKGPHMAQDGHRPLPAPTTLQKGYQPNPANTPGKVQGGYQAPGGGKPATPTTGSGVKPAAPSGGKK
jgi:hypothetical protein